jgi:2'-5' RNA ligase
MQLSSRRCKPARDFERRRSNLSSRPFAVDRFILFESHLSRHGPNYEEVGEYPSSQDYAESGEDQRSARR